jgi:hypothetical protein
LTVRSQVLTLSFLQNLVLKDYRKQFLMQELTYQDVRLATENGTDAYEMLADAIYKGTDTASRNETQMEDMIKVMDSFNVASNTVVGTLFDQYRAGKLNGDQLYESMKALDEVADAFDDNREKLEENAKAMLTNTETVAGLSNILGTEYLNSLIVTSIAEAKAAGITDVYAYALEKVRVAADGVLQGLRPVEEALIAESEAAVQATTGLAQLDNIMNLLRLSSEDGKIGIMNVADSLGILAKVAGNELQMALINAQEASVKLTDSSLISTTAVVVLRRLFASR